MRPEVIRKYFNSSIILLLFVGIYHILIYLTDIDKIYLYALYYISWNLLFVFLLLLAYSLLKPFKTIGSLKYTPLIISAYPLTKIIINVLYIFDSIRPFIIQYKDIISFSMIAVILLIFITMRYGTMD